MKPIIKTLSVCTLATLMTAPVMAMQEGEITIWINGDKSYQGLAEIGRQFEQDTGVKVIVQHPESLEAKFQQHAATGGGQTSFSGPMIVLVVMPKRVCFTK
jgi:maltose/maltodextrin transport system substrate-binding protein